MELKNCVNLNNVNCTVNHQNYVRAKSGTGSMFSGVNAASEAGFGTDDVAVAVVSSDDPEYFFLVFVEPLPLQYCGAQF